MNSLELYAWFIAPIVAVAGGFVIYLAVSHSH